MFSKLVAPGRRFSSHTPGNCDAFHLPGTDAGAGRVLQRASMLRGCGAVSPALVIAHHVEQIGLPTGESMRRDTSHDPETGLTSLET